MTEKDYYPEGAYNDSNAPWNQVDNPEIEVEVAVSVTLSKTVRIKVNDYKILDSGKDRNGIYYEDIDYSDCDLKSAVEEQVYLPYEAGHLLRNLDVAEADMYSEELSGWNVDDFTVTLE